MDTNPKKAKITQTESWNLLPGELKVHLLSFFSDRALSHFVCTSKESYQQTQEIFKIKLRDKFNYNLNCDTPPRLIYNQLCKERDLFGAFVLHEYIDHAHFDFFLCEKWLQCVLQENSFGPFLSAVKKAAQNFQDIYYKREKEEFSEAQQKAITQFDNLLNNSDKTDKKSLMEELGILCRIDAYTTINLICKKNPLLSSELSQLLSIAIGSLNLATVETLIGLGADVHKPLLCLHDTDNGFNTFSSPLYYAIALPSNPQSIIGRILRSPFSPDNPKLLKIIHFLLDKGANPEQPCILTQSDDFNLEQAEVQVEADSGDTDCKKLSQTFLNNPLSKELSTDYQKTLANIIAWISPDCSAALPLFF